MSADQIDLRDLELLDARLRTDLVKLAGQLDEAIKDLEEFRLNYTRDMSDQSRALGNLLTSSAGVELALNDLRHTMNAYAEIPARVDDLEKRVYRAEVIAWGLRGLFATGIALAGLFWGKG